MTKNYLPTPKSGDRAIFAQTIKSGQPRAYADTEYVVQLRFLSVPYQCSDWEPDPSYVPGEYTGEHGTEAKIAERVTEHVRHLIGFQRTKAEHATADFNGHFDSYLDYVQYTGKDAIWEARIVTPYDD